MTIITRKRADQYAIVPNAVANDERLTFEERGVLVYLLAKPHDWNVSVKNLQNVGGIGRDKVYKILKRLSEVGYITRSRVTDTGGRVVRFDYVVHDDAVPNCLPLPAPDSQKTSEPHPENQEAVEPLPENPVTGNPVPENQDTYKELNLPNTPPTPLEGGSSRLMDRLVACWPKDKIGEMSSVARAFEALSETDQQRSEACAATAIRAWRLRGGRLPKLKTYLAEHLWNEFFGGPPVDKDGDFIITPDRPEWSPWLGDIRGRWGQRGVDTVVKAGRYCTKQRWPHGHGVSA